MAQDNDFALLRWQGIDEIADLVVGLAADHVRLRIALGALEHVEDVEGLRLANLRAALVAAEAINTHIVADAHRPLQELSFVVILAAAQRINYFDEHFLKDVLSLAVVLRKKIDGSVDFLLVTAEEFLKCTIGSRKVFGDQSLISQ